MLSTRLAAAAMAGLITAATAAGPALASAPAAAPKLHYIGSCHASGSYPICTISASTAYDPRTISVHVWGTVRISGGGAGRIEADTDSLCEQGNGSGDDSGTFKLFPSYTRALRLAYSRASDCFTSAEISPVNYEGHGTIHADMYYTRRDGR
jgi:hypothetical protein